ncbi:hypothetical protein D9611_003724 [Ephemerocybe angulata]|uniref:BTB domain-containing protein n=1 Tax=Ephemerocybe angulata TaxID=980116 RepID=A0A8H5EYV0_9AGAR|nr:hypothetical protein D9611_003724 [Tulosesus angulatus]
MSDSEPPQYLVDDGYYWKPNFVTLLADGYLFRVPDQQFLIHSPKFSAKFLSLATDAGASSNKGQTDDPVTLPESISAAQIRAVCKLLYPNMAYANTLSVELTKDEWLDVATFSTTWRFDRLRKLAIDELDSLVTDPFEAIHYGREAFVVDWVVQGYVELVCKVSAITEEESEEIGYSQAIRLWNIRHEFRHELEELWASTSSHEDSMMVGDEGSQSDVAEEPDNNLRGMVEELVLEKFADEVSMLDAGQDLRAVEMDEEEDSAEFFSAEEGGDGMAEEGAEWGKGDEADDGGSLSERGMEANGSDDGGEVGYEDEELEFRNSRDKGCATKKASMDLSAAWFLHQTAHHESTSEAANAVGAMQESVPDEEQLIAEWKDNSVQLIKSAVNLSLRRKTPTE